MSTQMQTGTQWDTASGAKLLDAFWDCIKKTVTRPAELFLEVKAGQGWGRPFFYAFIITAVVNIVIYAYYTGFKVMAAGGAGLFVFKLPQTVSGADGSPSVIAAPLLNILMLVVQAALLQVSLRILGSAKAPMAATFRLICYSQGVQFFQLVPFIGDFVSGVWFIILVIIGVKVCHETTTSRAVFAVLLPTLVIMGLALAVLALAAGSFLGIMTMFLK